MSAAAPPPPSLSPADAEASGAIIWLWVPAAVLGNAVALYFLWQALVLARPDISCHKLASSASRSMHASWAWLRSKLASFTCWGTRHEGTKQELDTKPVSNCAKSHGGMSELAYGDVAAAKLADDEAQHPTEGNRDSDLDADIFSPACVKLLRDARTGQQSVRLEWKGLGCLRQTSSGPMHSLRGVCGCAEPGQITALIGASGSGKSTLLDILAMRGVDGTGVSVTGKVLINGQLRADSSGTESSFADGSKHKQANGDSHPSSISSPRQLCMSRDEFLAVSTYVPQEDHLLPQMTVNEVLMLHARLLLPVGTPKQVIQERIDFTLSVMGLQLQVDTLVGGTLLGGLAIRGISGGERRRLAIGAACLAGPSLLFLDEPTSGLDSFSALGLVSWLRALADAGHTLLVSIHQPRASIWNMMDRVLLLSQGLMMYEGPTTGVVPWFTGQEMGFRYDPHTHGVVPDWAIDIVLGGTFHSDGVSTCENEDESGGSNVASSHLPYTSRQSCLGSQEEVANAARAFARHRLLREEKCEHLDHAASCSANSADPAMSSGSTATASEPAEQSHGRMLQHVVHVSAFAKSTKKDMLHRLSVFALHVRVLLWRETCAITRNPLDVAGRMLLFVWIGLFANAIVYAEKGGASSMYQRVVWYFSLPFFYLVIPYVFISLFVADKNTYLGDMAARLYKPLPFYIARVAATAPFNLLIALIFGWIGYGMYGFRHTGLAWIQSTACSALFSLVAMQWMHFAVTLAPNVDVAFMMAVAFTIFNVLINGFFMSGPTKNTVWISKLRYVSALDWCWKGCMVAEFAGRMFDCSEETPLPVDVLGLFPELLPDVPSLRLIRAGLMQPGEDCVASGDAFLDFYGISTPVGYMVGYLIAYLAVLHVATYGALLFTARHVAGR